MKIFLLVVANVCNGVFSPNSGLFYQLYKGLQTINPLLFNKKGNYLCTRNSTLVYSAKYFRYVPEDDLKGTSSVFSS
jgi:hypothetical protein